MVRGSVVALKKNSSPRYGNNARSHKLSPTYQPTFRTFAVFKPTNTRVTFTSEILEKELSLVIYPVSEGWLSWSFSFRSLSLDLYPEPESIHDMFDRSVDETDINPGICITRQDKSLDMKCIAPINLTEKLCLAVQLVTIVRCMFGISHQNDASFIDRVLFILEILKTE